MLVEEFGIDNEMEVWMPLLSTAVVGNFEGVDAAADFGFPILRSSKPATSGLELVDLVGEAEIVGDRGESDEFRSVKGSDQRENSDKHSPASGLRAERAEAALTSTFGDSDAIGLAVDDDDRG